VKARPTTYNGIQMRSRLEARVAAWLDSLGLEWTYEPKAFASAKGQYLPDFEIHMNASAILRRPVFLEVKGKLDLKEYVETQDRMAAIVTASDPRAFLLVADAAMLETGLVAAYNFPRLGEWDEVLLVDFLVRTRMVALCDHWRMPEWNA
jgi:hypothetical protein